MGRPVGVTILAVLYFLGAVCCVLAGILMILGGGFIATLISQQAQGAGVGAGVLAGLGAALGVVILIFAAVDVLLGWGLWKLKNWARIVTIVLAAIGIAGALFGLLGAFLHFGMFLLVLTLVRLAISGLIIWYLLQPNVTAAFQGGQARAASA
jgi:hypothetical protein